MKQDYKNQLVYGRKPVLELIENGRQIEKIFVQKGTSGEFEIALRNSLKGKNIPVSFVHPNKLNKFTNQNHQGVVALTSLIEYWELDTLIEDIYLKGEAPNLILLDSVTDVRNFGSIIRSAEVLGIHGIIISTKNSATINNTTIKTSAGAAFNIPIAKVKSLSNAVKLLKDSGIAIYATYLHSLKSMSEIDFSVPCCTIIGSEDEGISSYMLKVADDNFKIEQVGKTDSLNVAVASGIVMYEILKQRLVTN